MSDRFGESLTRGENAARDWIDANQQEKTQFKDTILRLEREKAELAVVLRLKVNACERCYGTGTWIEPPESHGVICDSCTDALKLLSKHEKEVKEKSY